MVPSVIAAIDRPFVLRRFPSVDLLLIASDPLPAVPEWITACHEIKEALPRRAFRPDRRQYGADVLIAHLPASPDQGALIYVTGVDLTLGDRRFVFGASVRERRAAIISTARLGGVAERLHKVMFHELGHIAGLDDCGSDACVMRPAPDVHALDARPTEPCRDCRDRLEKLS